MRGRRPELKAIEGSAPPLAPRPDYIPKSMHREWDRVVSDLQARKLFQPSMLGLIASYVNGQFQAAECIKAIQQDGAFVRTKTGEPKPHPAHGLLNKAQELIARLGAELGLSPAARSRKGLQGPSGGEQDEGAPAGLDL